MAGASKTNVMIDIKGDMLNYHEYPKMFHAWMLLNLPEPKEAKKQVRAFIRKL